MKKTKISTIKTLLLLFTNLMSFTFFVAQNYKINVEKALIEFNYVSEETTGTIKGVTGEISFNPSDLSSFKFEGNANIKSINTSNKMRDSHLNAEDYFHTELYPHISFVAKQLAKKDGQFVLKGDMTIKDIVKNEEILFNFEDGAFSGRCVMYSNDYNIHTQKTREKSKILIKITVPVL